MSRRSSSKSHVPTRSQKPLTPRAKLMTALSEAFGKPRRTGSNEIPPTPRFQVRILLQLGRIEVAWQDGPTDQQVRKVVDSVGLRYEVRSLAIDTNRELSPKFLAQLAGSLVPTTLSSDLESQSCANEICGEKIVPGVRAYVVKEDGVTDSPICCVECGIQLLVDGKSYTRPASVKPERKVRNRKSRVEKAEKSELAEPSPSQLLELPDGFRSDRIVLDPIDRATLLNLKSLVQQLRDEQGNPLSLEAHNAAARLGKDLLTATRQYPVAELKRRPIQSRNARVLIGLEYLVGMAERELRCPEITDHTRELFRGHQALLRKVLVDEPKSQTALGSALRPAAGQLVRIKDRSRLWRVEESGKMSVVVSTSTARGERTFSHFSNSTIADIYTPYAVGATQLACKGWKPVLSLEGVEHDEVLVGECIGNKSVLESNQSNNAAVIAGGRTRESAPIPVPAPISESDLEPAYSKNTNDIPVIEGGI